jgi:hypothetical protein
VAWRLLGECSPRDLGDARQIQIWGKRKRDLREGKQEKQEYGEK